MSEYFPCLKIKYYFNLASSNTTIYNITIFLVQLLFVDEDESMTGKSASPYQITHISQMHEHTPYYR